MNKILEQRIPLLRWTGWFFFGNALLFWFIGLQYLDGIMPHHLLKLTWLITFIEWLFLIVSWIGHFAFLAYLPCVLILPLVLIFPKKNYLFPLAILCATFSTALLSANTVVFQQYHFHISGFIWEMLLSHAASEIFDFSTKEYTIAGLFLLILFAAEYVYAEWLWQKIKLCPRTPYGSRLLLIIPTCLLFSYLMFLLSAIQPYSVIAQQPQSFPLYHVLLERLPLGSKKYDIETVGKTQFQQPAKYVKTLQYPRQPLVFHPPVKPLNLVVIVIDAWRFDMLNHAVTPTLENWSKKSWYFTQHRSGGNGTQPGIFSLFYGLPGTYWSSMEQQKQGPVLIHSLLQAHYQMGIFASAPLSMPAFDQTVFREVVPLQTKTIGKDAAERDSAATRAFMHFIHQPARQTHPFFSFIFYDAAHSACDIKHLKGPFSPTTENCNRLLLSKNTPALPYFNLYKNALWQIDQQIKQVFDALQKTGLLEQTVIVVTGDHGQEFNDNHQGFWGHASNFTPYQIQTPLLIVWPKQTPRVFKHLTSHYDVAPTLMHRLLGCRNPASDFSLGQSLFKSTPPPYLLVTSYIDFGIIEPDRVTTVYPAGNYQIDGLDARPLAHANLRVPILRRVLNDFNLFYQQPKRI